MNWTPRELRYQDDRYGTVPFGYVISYKDNEIVGVLNLHTRKIKTKTQDIVLGGLGGMCTHSKFRRQGIATQLLKRGMKVLEDNKCDIAFLCTDLKTLAPLYARVGFVPLNRKYKATGATGKIYTDEEGMIAPVNSKTIFRQVLENTEPFDLQGQDW